MNKFFYTRLAATNIKKNAKIYLPYLLACISTVMMFYIMVFISGNEGVSKMPGHEALQTIMILGSIVIGIFSMIILLYTNSFLIKRRKKELGLFNILGMEKKHIARIMAIENFYVAVIALVLGLSGGILFSKLMLLFLFKLLRFPVPFGFTISMPALVITLLLFASIFILTLIGNLRRVHLAKPIELLYGGNTGEREPKTKWLLAILGVLSLSGGYTIAIITKSPLNALALFFVAVILVIIGTYCLFTAGSIVLLKRMRKIKSFYYQTTHFTAVSGMIYRMKQNAVGLANICILSTMVLVMISGTISMYFGMEDALRNQYPRDIEVEARNISFSETALLEAKLDQAVENSGLNVKNTVAYRNIKFIYKRDGVDFTFDRTGTYASPEYAVVIFIPLDMYNKMQGESAVLGENELLAYFPNSKYTEDTVVFNGLEYRIKNRIQTLNVENYLSLTLTGTYYFVVPDEQAIQAIYNAADTGESDWGGMSYYYGLDVEGSGEDQLRLTKSLADATVEFGNETNNATEVYTTCIEDNKGQFLALYGGFFFLGLFLGALFLMATVMIMYYKQISEGYEDKSRFEIMQKVGMSRDEVKKTIRSQVLLVFFLPLAAACIHIAAAFLMITRLLRVLDLTNVALFALCTVGTILVFALFYLAIYVLTARAYYKIVES